VADGCSARVVCSTLTSATTFVPPSAPRFALAPFRIHSQLGKEFTSLAINWRGGRLSGARRRCAFSASSPHVHARRQAQQSGREPQPAPQSGHRANRPRNLLARRPHTRPTRLPSSRRDPCSSRPNRVGLPLATRRLLPRYAAPQGQFQRNVTACFEARRCYPLGRDWIEFGCVLTCSRLTDCHPSAHQQLANHVLVRRMASFDYGLLLRFLRDFRSRHRSDEYAAQRLATVV
jgi:hypothetical protein